MAQIILLGTGSAWSGPDRENTYMLVQGASTNLMIDCAGSPAQRLAKLGISPAVIDHLILTHNHPDHIYGLPMLALNSWMAGRRTPLHIYGLKATLRSARLMLRAVEVNALPNFFKIHYHPIVPGKAPAKFAIGEFDVAAVESVHFVPTLALRVTDRATGKCFAYSSDTSPHPNIITISHDVDLFFHEATMLDKPGDGHSTAVEAGQEAAQAHVKRLILLHLPPQVSPTKWRAAAKRTFPGRVTVASDFDKFEF